MADPWADDGQDEIDGHEIYESLHEAAVMGQIEAVRELIDSGHDVSELDDTGFTPLHLACDNGFAKVAKMLLDAGAEPDEPDEPTGAPAIHLASFEGHVKVVKLLIDWKADVNIEDDDGNTALSLAVLAGHHVVAKMLLAAMVAGYPPHWRAMRWISTATKVLHDAVAGGNHAVVKMLLDAGADVDALDEETDATALIRASQRGFNQIVIVLLDGGAYVDACGKTRTPNPEARNPEPSTLNPDTSTLNVAPQTHRYAWALGAAFSCRFGPRRCREDAG